VYFVVFCNLINILDVGADFSDAVKIKIEIRGFLQLRKSRAVTARGRAGELARARAPACAQWVGGRAGPGRALARAG
jgi:hypothetical protein